MYRRIGVVHAVKEGVEWVIADYFSHFGEYQSPAFPVAGESFVMMIDVCPMGDDSDNIHIQLGLDRDDDDDDENKPDGPPIYLDFSFGVKTRDGKKYGETPWIEFHNNAKFYPCEITLEANRISDLLQKGTLTILCSLKPKKIKEDEPGLVEDFKQLFLSQEDSDVILRVKKREFKAHRVVLKARSSVFRSILRSDTKESATGIVDIQDLDPSVFPDFLSFLYYGELGNDDELLEDSVFGLFAAADKYNVPHLRARCIQFMGYYLSVDNFCDIFRLALLHSETKLIRLSKDCFMKKASRIIKTDGWKKFVEENPVESNELFMKFVASEDYESE